MSNRSHIVRSLDEYLGKSINEENIYQNYEHREMFEIKAVKYVIQHGIVLTFSVFNYVILHKIRTGSSSSSEIPTT